MYAENVDFSGGKSPTVTANGQLLIGSAVSPNIRVGTLSSSDGSITWNVGAGTISGVISGGTTVGKTITGDSGGALPPSSGNWNLLGTGSITTSGAGSTLTTQLTGLTNHSVLVGAGTATITKVAPSATSGVPLISQGAAADPAFGTAVVAGGGTGQVTLTNHGVLVGAGTTAITQLSVGTNGQLLTGSTGADPVFATPTSTGGAYIAGAGTSKYIPANFMPGSSNIGIAYSSPTFTVQGYDGTALSSTNPGYVTLPSKANPGRFVTIAVTANQTFTDGSTGTTDNARFGVTTGVNWSNDIPFFLYGVMDDTEAVINFMISRNPCATTSPASTSISKTGAIINVNQADFFSLGDITVTSYDSNPCICLGSFRMQFVGATDSWTVSALANNDGIGRFNEETTFTFPSGQNGAASGTYILSNAGTEPVFTTNQMQYWIHKNGQVRYKFDGVNASTGGVGANTLQPVCPYANQGIALSGQGTIMTVYINGGTSVVTLGKTNLAASSSALTTIVNNAASAALTNAGIALTDSLNFVIIYQAF